MIRKFLGISLLFGLLWAPALAPAQCTRCGAGLSLAPSSLNFGSVSVGKRSAVLKVTARNYGVSPANINLIGISGAGFLQTNTCPKSLAHSASCTVSVVFAPQALKPYTGRLTVTYNGIWTATTWLAGQGTK